MSTAANSAERREAALRFLTGRIDFERTLSMPSSEAAFKLDRMKELLARLGNPQNDVPIVHVAGTKGKGSTAALVAAMLSVAGYRTGLFTSPHLERVEERIVLDGAPCSADEFAELVEHVRPAVEAMDRGTTEGGRRKAEGGKVECGEWSVERGARAEGGGRKAEEEVVSAQWSVASVEDTNPQSPIPNPSSSPAVIPPSPFPLPPSPFPLGPTYFEILTAMAFCHFSQCRATAAVVEVGLGGRLDSTNVCTPVVAIITNISFDHTKQLGETLSAIAAEKAGIIKSGVPVVSGVDAEEPREVVRRIAREKDCRLVELGVDFSFDYHAPRHLERAAAPAKFDFRGNRNLLSNISLAMPGRHQAANAAVALAAIEELRQIGWTIPDEAVRCGLAEVVWPARVEVVARRPAVVLDAAHNVASIAALVEVLEESFSARMRLLIFATTQEKDIRGMLRLLISHFDRIIFTRYTDNPRGVPPEELLRLAVELQRDAADGEMEYLSAETEIAATPAEAWKIAREAAEPDDLICIAGSFFLASEMRRRIGRKNQSP